MKVFAIDPGLTSGVCIVSITPDGSELALEYSAELGMKELGFLLETELPLCAPGTFDVVCERFTIGPGTGKNTQAPWSLEVIGMVRWLALRHGSLPNIALQSPGDAKSFATNVRLKHVGLWHAGGEGHALDALRHALVYLVRNGKVDTTLLA